MAKLTALQIRNQKEPCRLADGQGLFFEITPTGIKRWLYRYKISGKGGKCILGRYPNLSLEQARSAHRDARELVRQGINPALARRREKQAVIESIRAEKAKQLTAFSCVALEWVEMQRGRWSRDHANAVLATLKADAFPLLGDIPIDTITPQDVLRVIRRIEDRGSLEIARKVLQRVSAVCRYAVQTGMALYNPAAEMQGVLKTRQVENMPALFNKDLGQLLRDISASQRMHISTKLALQFTALTAARSGEVRHATWAEIDLEAGLWEISAERMKMRRAHIVPLSKQAVAVLNRTAALFGRDGLLFPSARDQHKPMSDNAMSKALRDMGYQGQATPHGFRSSFSSSAYESGRFPSEVIERALAHVEQNKIKGAYNRAEYLGQRRELLQWWGDLLQRLEHGAEIIPFKRQQV
jgi:integrase